MSAEFSSENTVISTIASSLFPAEYKVRMEENAAALVSAGVTLPVFFYNSTKLPGGTIELCLFEPRYRTMMVCTAHVLYKRLPSMILRALPTTLSAKV